jgi:hypothetical protein
MLPGAFVLNGLRPTLAKMVVLVTKVGGKLEEN